MEISNDGIPEPNRNQEPEYVRSTRQQQRAELYIVTTFKSAKCFSFATFWFFWDLLHRALMRYNNLKNFELRNVGDILDSMHNSIWRRVFANNYTYFYSSDTNVSAYVIEQSRRPSPIRVLDEVFVRQRNGAFNQLGILEIISSPYYYVLPYQIERDNESIKKFILHGIDERNVDKSLADEELYSFKSRLNVARKNA
ncbi:hypothetical protein TNCT_462571 [Trichonephila clavata]|uniref:Uncharacterized protein n=1 Tax=Trichonephila clavata TaxID=2740835 RepID=A0A8X6GG47_TRICU|nr:hypothetical protein TNCT_462571 [Trichonephila clavata]